MDDFVVVVAIHTIDTIYYDTHNEIKFPTQI